MPQETTHRQLVYFPYLALGNVDELRDGNITVWNADKKLDAYVADPETRRHVRALLDLNRAPGREAGTPLPVSGIGVVSIRSVDFRPLTASEKSRVGDLRAKLFLAALSHNAKLKSGVNAGHSLYTTENFDIVYQNFKVGSKSVSEETGFLVRVQTMGYTIAETRWFRPRHVPSPSPFRTDDKMLSELDWLRAADRQTYRRILRAAAVFMESYYNASNVDAAARVLLQLMAFEILLEIPDDKQRMHFKQQIGSLCRVRGEREVSYLSERPGGKKVTEHGPITQMWADHFYTLRNHLIHGEAVGRREFLFRGAQHHLIASPTVFIARLYQLINQARRGANEEPRFTDILRWRTWTDSNDVAGKRYRGFVLEPDWESILTSHWRSD